LKAEIDALKNGEALPAPAEGSTPKKPATPRKRKVKTDDEAAADADASPKKARGRPKKKAAEPEPEIEDEATVKEEVHGDEDLEAET
jgi:hypothetical protein